MPKGLLLKQIKQVFIGRWTPALNSLLKLNSLLDKSKAGKYSRETDDLKSVAGAPKL